MGRPRSTIKALRDAEASGDNLAILKAQRGILIEDMSKASNPEQRLKFSKEILNINKVILKEEGARTKNDDVDREVNDIMAARNSLNFARRDEEDD